MVFEDIKITDLEVELTRQSDTASGLRYMYLKLSGSPPSEWSEIFRAEREFPRHTMWRRAWIQGDYIVIDCAPDEIEKYHLRDLKQDVDNSNRKYKDYLALVERKRESARNEKEEEKKKLNDLKNKLNFD